MGKAIIPLGDRVLVKPDVPPDKTAGGLYVPEVAKEIPAEGVVVAIGPGIKMKDGGRANIADVKVGDHVVYSKYGGTDLKINGVVHKIMREDDISGIVVEETDADARRQELQSKVRAEAPAQPS